MRQTTHATDSAVGRLGRGHARGGDWGIRAGGHGDDGRQRGHREVRVGSGNDNGAVAADRGDGGHLGVRQGDRLGEGGRAGHGGGGQVGGDHEWEGGEDRKDGGGELHFVGFWFLEDRFRLSAFSSLDALEALLDNFLSRARVGTFTT